MKKIILIISILGIIFLNTTSYAYTATKIDLKIKEGEVNVVFIKLQNSKSILIKDEKYDNLFITDYKNDKNLNKTIKIFNSHPNIYYLNNTIAKKIDNIYINKTQETMKIRINNYTLCIYHNPKTISEHCNFIYIKSLNKPFPEIDNISAIIYDSNIPNKYLKNVQESWIDNYIVSSDSFTILKINEESYNFVIVPSTNY